MARISGPEFGPLSGNAPKQLVIILHGYGADGENLIDLAPALASLFPDAHFIAPNAPHRCEAGGMGYQWFSLMNRAPEVMLAGVESATPYVNELLDEKLAALKLTEAQTAIIGFSQGTMTGLHVALTRAQPLAGMVGFSGAMMTQHITSKTPTCLIHGQMDDVVPFASMGIAEAALKAAGVSVETHARPYLPHSIDNEGLSIAARFLAKQFSIEIPAQKMAM